jgi:hypothetical protein
MELLEGTGDFQFTAALRTLRVRQTFSLELRIATPDRNSAFEEWHELKRLATLGLGYQPLMMESYLMPLSLLSTEPQTETGQYLRTRLETEQTI